MQAGLNIAVVGGGPLGTLFAAYLTRGGSQVTLVKRRSSSATESYHLVPQLVGSAFDVELRCANDLPAGVDVVVVAVRAEQLDAQLLAMLKAVRAQAVLVFSPLLGEKLTQWRAQLPGLAVGMPVLAAEFSIGEKNWLHYWQVPSTVIERGPAQVQLQSLVDSLKRGGAWVRWVSDAEARVAANTVAMFPLHVAVFRSSHMRDWLNDGELRRELAAALGRSLRLAKRLGPLEPALVVLVWWLSKAWRISAAVWLMRLVAPRVCAFVERHFGAKLGRQHAVLAQQILALANAHDVAAPLCERWMAELREASE